MNQMKIVGALLVAGTIASIATYQSALAGKKAPSIPGLKLENLLTAELERVEGTEVVVSRVTLPPNTTLPKHWHPGEEFAYILEGSGTVWQKGKKDTPFKAGETAQISLKQVHTATSGPKGATILVFRVHEKGKPERYPAE